MRSRSPALPPGAAEKPPGEAGRSGITCCGGLCLVTPGLARGLASAAAGAHRPRARGPAEPPARPHAGAGPPRLSQVQVSLSFCYLNGHEIQSFPKGTDRIASYSQQHMFDVISCGLASAVVVGVMPGQDGEHWGRAGV